MDSRWRQKLHLEPPQGWLNDPNGLCYFNGKYHVYFQYAPESADGSSLKGWGHYESSDFLHWEFTGVVLKPDIPEDKDGVYSGSAFTENGLLYLFYTGNVKWEGDYDYIREGREANVICVTSSDGRRMSEKKVLLRNLDYPKFCSRHVRDPKVWKQNGTYYMILGARTLEDKGCVLFYHSEDLENWKYLTCAEKEEFGYMWECPDYFELNGNKYLSISPQGLKKEYDRYQNVYQSGYFHADSRLTDFKEWDYGFDYYAPQTFSVPDGRRIIIGWMGIADCEYTNATTELGWQHCLTVPRSVTVDENGNLLQNPIHEINTLRIEKIQKKDSLCLPFDLVAEVTGNFCISLNQEVTMSWEKEKKIFALSFSSKKVSGGRTIRRVKMEQCRNIRLIADMSSLEIYLDDGRYVMSSRYYPEKDWADLSVAGIVPEIWKLKSMEMI